MNWNVYLESESLSSNVRVSIFDYIIDGEPTPLPIVGDALTIEYPSNLSAAGIIKDISGNQIEVEINGQLSRWKLIETNKNNGKITLNYVVT